MYRSTFSFNSAEKNYKEGKNKESHNDLTAEFVRICFITRVVVLDHLVNELHARDEHRPEVTLLVGQPRRIQILNVSERQTTSLLYRRTAPRFLLLDDGEQIRWIGFDDDVDQDRNGIIGTGS